MNLKDASVNLDGVRAPILHAMSVIEPIMLKYGTHTATSVKDSHEHKPRSLHNFGLAYDIRTWGIKDQETRDTVILSIQTALGPDYEVFDEQNHYHCEVSPNWLARNGDPRKGIA